MSTTLQTAILQTRSVMLAKYPNWEALAPSERRLLTMAYLADEIKVREVGGNNRGKWVEIFQEAAGIGPGDPWCAAALTLASIVAEAPYPQRPDGNPASVIGWRRWAKSLGTLIDSPGRGSICMHQTSESQGHIGVAVRVLGLWVYSIEGNTSSGDEGSQRDGGGLYRRVRLKSFWSWGFAQ